MKRVVRIVAILAAVWLLVLFALGFVLSGRAAERVRTRLAQALQTPVTIEEHSLGLVRGSFAFERLVAKRDDAAGKLTLEVGSVACDLPPLGLAVVERRCSELAIRDVTLELSTIAMFQIRPPRERTLAAERVVVDHADLVFLPSAFVPGLGRVRIQIAHAEAGPTAFKSPLSWLFALQSLRASLELPPGITLDISYADGKLVASGGVFGAKPVTVAVTLPKPSPDDDARTEIGKLVAVGKDIAAQLVAQKAEDWMRGAP